jgi:hypothetical protein
MHTVDCFSWGVPLRLLIGGDHLLAALPHLLPIGTLIDSPPVADAATFTLLPPGSERGYRCYTGSELKLESGEAGPVFEQFSRELILHVADFSPHRVFVHAGAVGWKDRAIVMPGSSFAGKTTLTAALVRAGATYLSDEYAVVDPLGWVHPFPRDLQMRQPGSSRQRPTPVESLHGKAATTPMRVAQVIFAHYQPGAAWDPQPVTSGMAVLEMMRHSIPAQRVPRQVMSTLTAVLQGATALSSARGEADALAHLLLQSLDANRPVSSLPA